MTVETGYIAEGDRVTVYLQTGEAICGTVAYKPWGPGDCWIIVEDAPNDGQRIYYVQMFSYILKYVSKQIPEPGH